MKKSNSVPDALKRPLRNRPRGRQGRPQLPVASCRRISATTRRYDTDRQHSAKAGPLIPSGSLLRTVCAVPRGLM